MQQEKTWTDVLNEDVAVPKLQGVDLLSDGWIKKYKLTYMMPNGQLYEYESVSRKGLEEYKKALESNSKGGNQPPDAVCIVPILPDDSLLLIREFRYPINAWCIAFPAGLLEDGESLEDCVNRELDEETGYRIRTDMDRSPLIPLPQNGYSSVGMGEENVRVIIAYVEPDGDAHPMPSEFIQTFALQRDDVHDFLETNQDLIGTRCQLLLEAVRRNQVLRKRLVLANNPITSQDYY